MLSSPRWHGNPSIAVSSRPRRRCDPPGVVVSSSCFCSVVWLRGCSSDSKCRRYNLLVIVLAAPNVAIVTHRYLRPTKLSNDARTDYTSHGAWDGSTWRAVNHSNTCRFHQAFTNDNDNELAAIFRRVKVGFMGDSTTRSDLRAWEETFKCPRTNLDEAQVFQKRNEQGSYICKSSEQSMNLTKCGVPPIINVTDCPPGVTFRYFYKIYPWTPLDRWYLTQQPDLLRDLDVLVLSLGRWFVYYEPRDFNVAEHLETFLVALKKVFSGVILYQSEYSTHLAKSEGLKYPVPCAPHAICKDCGDTDQHECSQTDETKRPQRDGEMRAVLERHHILYLDRWNVSKSLPLEYFQPWYCHNGTIHQWFCSHHLGFVALQHMRLVANVVKHLFVSKQQGGQ